MRIEMGEVSHSSPSVKAGLSTDNQFLQGMHLQSFLSFLLHCC